MTGKLSIRFDSTRLVALAPVLMALLTACAGSAGGRALPPASGTQNYREFSNASTTAVAPHSVPPQGVYNSCEIDTALAMCEQEDAAIASDGFKWEINHIGIDANKSGFGSLKAWFTYDASIGLGQVIDVASAINDRANVLTGKILLTSPYTGSLAKSCGVTTNEHIISCINSVASSVPGFNWKWYIYDEPGCPNQSIGYCRATLAGGNYQNVQTLARYINSIDPSHEIIGTQVGDTGNQTAINNLYSWLLTPLTAGTGFDRYPIPSGGAFGSVDDVGTIAGEIANTIAATNPSENLYFVGQAFSWFQESGKGCTSITACPYPTTTELRDERDQALYYADKAGKPLSMIFWYYWPDITCMNSYPGCNAAANRAGLKSAAFAPFPTPIASLSPSASPKPSGSPKPTLSPRPSNRPSATPAPTSSPISIAGLPPQGVYNSCEIDTALTSLCEQEDAAIVSDGFKWEINYIGLDANKTGFSSLKEWFTYDAAIGLGQAISVKAAINDRTNVLTGKILRTSPFTGSLAKTCGATTNAQVIACIYSVASSVPGFKWMWYIYDEPGCPNQSIGYCQGTLAGGNYQNVHTLASYIHSIDPSHEVMGTQVGDNGDQTVTNNLYSWLTNPMSNGTAFDHYPIPSNPNFGSIGDIGTISGQLAKTIATNNPSENLYFVGQAFSWYQEDGKGCKSITVCPYPTTTQMREERDQALYYAKKAGKPVSMIFWYYWPDITCINKYAGCNGPANRASLRSAAFAPFPTSPP